MRGLNEITLINSASLNYSNILLNGNTLLSGANGTGKTTILRAILFFYHANARKVDINSAKKKGFKEYYFGALNSYLLYKYKNIFGVSYVLMYKTSLLGDIKYRFFRSTNDIDIEKLFFENNIALGIADIITSLRKIDVDVSTTIQSAKEYRDILYDHNKVYKQFALFNTNKEYAQIHNTISNIFINSKLDSNVIKKSLVNTVEDFIPIDLNQIRNNISQFLDEIKDIKAYGKNKNYITQSLNYLVDYQSSKKILEELACGIFAQVSYSKILIQDIEQKQLSNNISLKAENENLNKKQIVFDKQMKFLTKQEILLTDFIKRAKEKQKEYEAQNIDDKILFFNKKDIFSNQLHSLKEEISLLNSSASAEAFKFDELISKQYNEFDAFKNKKQTKINEEQKELLISLKVLQQLQVKELKKLDEFYLTEIEDKEIEILNNKHNLKDEQNNHKIIKNKEFLKEEKEKLSKSIEENKISQYKLTSMIEQSKNNMSSIDGKIELLEINRDNEIVKLGVKLQVNKNNIDGLIKDIQQKLNIDNDTFLGLLRDKKHKDTAVLSCILKDNILFSKDLNPIISNDNSNSIYGVQIDTQSLDMSLYDDSILEDKLKQYFDSIDKLKLKYDEQKEDLVSKSQKNLKQFYKEKKELNDNINSFQIDLNKLNSIVSKDIIQLDELKNRAISLKNEELKSIDNKITTMQSSLKIEEEKYNYVKKQFNSKIKSIKLNTTKDENILKDTISSFELNINSELKEYEENIKAKVDELSLQKFNILEKKGIDTDSLKTKEQNVKQLEENLETINKLSRLINDYEKDKKELILLIPIKNSELKMILKEIEQLDIIYKKESEKFTNVIKDLNDKQEMLKDEFNKFDLNIKEFTSIEDLPIYQRLIPFKDDAFVVNSYENMSSIKDKIYGVDEQIKISLQKLGKSLNLVFRNISQNNILNIYPPKSSEYNDILKSAFLLKEFEANNKIKTFQEELSSRYSLSLSHYEQEIRNLLNAQGTIQKTISKITKKLKDLKNIKVIQKVELRYNNTQDKAVQLLIELKNLYENNSFQSDVNLFNPLGANHEFNQKVIEIFEKLNEYLYEYNKKEFINLDDSFVLEFRAIENGNDTGFVQILDDVGSNGTDVMIKVMVYITMLNLALEQSLNKNIKSSAGDDLYLHCILDEVGILSPKYLKELIHYANEQNIRFINGAPDEKIVTTYKRVYMLRTTSEHKTIVNEIVASV